MAIVCYRRCVGAEQGAAATRAMDDHASKPNLQLSRWKTLPFAFLYQSPNIFHLPELESPSQNYRAPIAPSMLESLRVTDSHIQGSEGAFATISDEERQ